jgi:hypothetical protein
MPDEVNVNAVLVSLQRIIEGFNFTVPGRDQSLGRDVLGLMVERIDSRVSNAVGPDGTPWPENSTKEPPKGGYKGQKGRLYGWTDPGKRTGQTTSVPSLRGNKTTIEANLITMRYGTDSKPSTGGSPTQLVTKQDERRTDTQKAEYMHTGGRWHVKLPFYQVGDGDAEAVTELCQENLDEYIRNANAENH